MAAALKIVVPIYYIILYNRVMYHTQPQCLLFAKCIPFLPNNTQLLGAPGPTETFPNRADKQTPINK